MGHAVAAAASAEEALALCRAGPADVVISGWALPGMDGPDFCRAFRALARDSYGYFILLTARGGGDEIARGLDAGADDFLAKPVRGAELGARIRAAARILAMERALVARNRDLALALDGQARARAVLEGDLAQARRLQEALVPAGVHRLGPFRLSLALRQSGQVGGDLVGFYPIDAGRAGLWAIDVSGHGVPAAMLAARLAGALSGATPDRNVALRPLAGGGFAPRPPAEAAARLNALALAEIGTDHYFTLFLAQLDLATGRLDMVQAGHPHPVLQRAGGAVSFVGEGGLPVGLIPGAVYAPVTLWLAPGDRLLVHSDGLTDIPGPGPGPGPGSGGARFGEAGVARVLAARAGLAGPAVLDALMAAARRHAGGADPPDDLSALLLERLPEGGGGEGESRGGSGDNTAGGPAGGSGEAQR